MSPRSDAGGSWAPAGANSHLPAVHCDLPRLFPLHRRPVPAWLPGSSHSCKRQQGRRAQCKIFNDVIDGLNWYSGRALDTAAADTRGGAASALREQAESRVAGIVDRQQPPADTPAPAEAFRELLRGRDAYAGVASGGQNIAPYRSAKLISMPESVEDAPAVSTLVSEGEFYLGGGLERMLRPDTEREMRDEELARIRPHTHPALMRGRRKYLAVVERLVSSGLFHIIQSR